MIIEFKLRSIRAEGRPEFSSFIYIFMQFSYTKIKVIIIITYKIAKIFNCIKFI